MKSALSGGDATVFTQSRDAFAKPVPNIPTAKLRDFAFGNKLFNTNWVMAPASVNSLDGLGPTFNRVSCSGCHFKDGRGQPPLNDKESMDSMLVRLSIPGEAEDGGPLPHPAYGDQLNDKANPGVPSEGRAVIRYRKIKGHYKDGTSYELLEPRYRFEDLAFGPLGEDIQFSPRVAPQIPGLGLLEAVPEETIRAMADPYDLDGDGISGRVNTIYNAKTGERRLGRFGWKANVPSLSLQAGGAARGDIGITNKEAMEENCPEPQKECRKAINGGEPEMLNAHFDKLVFYLQTLAIPARRDVEDKQVQWGAILFEQSACSSCHTPSLTTGKHEVSALSKQQIQPFTDLLLHDMGEGLADYRPDFEAGGTEWRTAPLWGIGLVETVNHHTRFLHDGRARNLEEAILWHGGEATASREKFIALSKKERAALLAFLRSL